MKTVKCALSLLLSVFIFISCAAEPPQETSDATITALEFNILTDVELSLDSEDPSSEGYIRITKNGTGKPAESEFVLLSEDDSIASIEILSMSSYLIKYRITAHSAGETHVYAASGDKSVTSSELKVTVKGKSDTADVQESSQTETETEPAQTEEIIPITESTDKSGEEPIISQNTVQNTEPYSAPKESPSADIAAEGLYVLNTKTKKIHHQGCSSIKQMKSENYGTSDDPDKMLSLGYTWCQRCHK